MSALRENLKAICRLAACTLPLCLSVGSALAQVSVHEALFPVEVDPAAGKPLGAVDPEHRPVLVMLEPAEAPTPPPKAGGRTFMVDRYSALQVVQALPATVTGPVHLVMSGRKPCALKPTGEAVIVVGAGSSGRGLHVLMAQGCTTPTNMYGGLAVVGPFEQALWIQKPARVTAVPPLELQEIPKGMSPDSNTARIVIPEMNRQRVADHEAAVRAAQTQAATSAQGLQGRGGIAEDDARLQPFLKAAASDERGKGFVPDLLIEAGQRSVHFRHADGRALMLSFNAGGQPVFTPERR